MALRSSKTPGSHLTINRGILIDNQDQHHAKITD